MAEWNGLGRYPEDADVNDRPEEGTLLAYVDGSYQDALKKYGATPIHRRSFIHNFISVEKTPTSASGE